MNKHRNRHKTWWNCCPRRWIIIEFTISKSWCYSSPFSLLFPNFSWSPIHGESFTLYNFLLDHRDRTLVSHLNLHLSTCPIRHLLWLFVNGSGWDYTVQGSSPHKCGQESCCSALNAVVTAFLLNISAFLSSSYAPEVHLIAGSSWKTAYVAQVLAGPTFPLSEKDNLLGLYSSTFPVCDPPFWGLFDHLLLLGRIHITK